MDPMFFLKKNADQDASPNKADLGVGIYRNEAGVYSEFRTVTKVTLTAVKCAVTKLIPLFSPNSSWRRTIQVTM